MRRRWRHRGRRGALFSSQRTTSVARRPRNPRAICEEVSGDNDHHDGLRRASTSDRGRAARSGEVGPIILSRGQRARCTGVKETGGREPAQPNDTQRHVHQRPDAEGADSSLPDHQPTGQPLRSPHSISIGPTAAISSVMGNAAIPAHRMAPVLLSSSRGRPAASAAGKDAAANTAP